MSDKAKAVAVLQASTSIFTPVFVGCFQVPFATVSNELPKRNCIFLRICSFNKGVLFSAA